MLRFGDPSTLGVERGFAWPDWSNIRSFLEPGPPGTVRAVSNSEAFLGRSAHIRDRNEVLSAIDSAG